MKEIYTRALSGGAYVLLLLLSFLVHRITFLSIVLLLALICLFEFQRIIHFKKWALYGVLIVSLVSLHILQIPELLIWLILGVTICTQLLLLKDLLYIRIIPMFEKKKYIVSLFYIITSFLFMSLIPFDKGGTYNPMLILGIFIIIWVNDSFAYLTGRQFGKHKLYEKISPKKTVEGFLGGLVAASITSIILAEYSTILNTWQWIFLGLITSVFGTIGDLIQSKFKRQAGIKDSGKIMPGHGGIFDRLDSVLYASPFVFLYLQIINYVS